MSHALSNAKVWQYDFPTVRSLTPNQNGVYGLFNSQGWIYVGKGDIRERLLAHLAGDNPCITRRGPTHWCGIVTADMDNLEKQLILHLDPPCNKRVG